MLSKEVENIINAVFHYARTEEHGSITIEHLLLTLLESNLVIQILVACNANLIRLRNNLNNYLTNHVAKISHADDTSIILQPDLSFQRVIQRAVFQAQAAGQKEVLSANLLNAILSEPKSHSATFLYKENLTRTHIADFMQNRKIDLLNNAFQPETQANNCDVALDHELFLAQYTTNLNLKAQNGFVDQLIGREEEVGRLMQILCRRTKNNPLLVGDAGVGKTAIVEGLAQAILKKQVPDKLLNTIIYSLDISSLLAGTKYRGEFEKRFKSILNKIKQQPGAIIFIDEIHIIIGAGSTNGGSIDVANLLKPVLTTSELTCIGATTYKEYRTVFAKDYALDRRFQQVVIKAPSVAQTIDILRGLKNNFEQHHNISYSDAALIAAANLAERYIPERSLPDKAIDLIDEVGAQYSIRAKTQAHNKIITKQDIAAVVAKIANIPHKNLISTQNRTLKNMANNLKRLIYGQDESIDALCAAVKLSQAGLRDHNKPIGAFLFIGPSGVGKTEVAKQLAQAMNVELLRFDMSEYTEQHTMSRLLGAPPGYLGYHEGGLLTEAVNKNRYSLVLLDEIEKANPDILGILLQIMDHGFLKDSNGRNIDFRHTIIILTSNVGADLLEKNTIGFNVSNTSANLTPAIKKFFSPELRNRLDAIIEFKPLQYHDILHVVDKFLNELISQLKSQHVDLMVDDAARDWLVLNGYDRTMGARTVGRLIEKCIKNQLVDELLFGKLHRGGTVVVTQDHQTNQLKLSIAK